MSSFSGTVGGRFGDACNQGCSHPPDIGDRTLDASVFGLGFCDFVQDVLAGFLDSCNIFRLQPRNTDALEDTNNSFTQRLTMRSWSRSAVATLWTRPSSGKQQYVTWLVGSENDRQSH